MEQILKIVLATDDTSTRKRLGNRLPLHDAVSTSKSVEFLKALIQKDQRTLSIRDPTTKLYPFQMAALGNLNKNAGFWAHARYSPEAWKSLRPEERAKAVDEVIEEKKAEQLSTICFLLRSFPMAVAPTTQPLKACFRDTRGNGMVFSLYLLMMYASNDVGDHFVLQSNLDLIEEAIEPEEIPPELESWWAKLKFWIRYCYRSEIRLPKEDKFLLHAAVGNEDVPPLVIELLLAIFPNSVTIPVHGGSEYPLHIAAATNRYMPQSFETINRRSTIQSLVDAYSEAADVRSPRDTPFEIALAKGTRSQDELKVLCGDSTCNDFSLFVHDLAHESSHFLPEM